MNFDLDALVAGPGPMLKLPLFLCLFLVVRGVPAWLLYRGVVSARDRAALAFFGATQLPMVVAITTVAVETGHMRSSTSAGLVGAAIVSTLVFPLIGLRLRRGRAARVEEDIAHRAGGRIDLSSFGASDKTSVRLCGRCSSDIEPCSQIERSGAS